MPKKKIKILIYVLVTIAVILGIILLFFEKFWDSPRAKTIGFLLAAISLLWSALGILEKINPSFREIKRVLYKKAKYVNWEDHIEIEPFQKRTIRYTIREKVLQRCNEIINSSEENNEIIKKNKGSINLKKSFYEDFKAILEEKSKPHSEPITWDFSKGFKSEIYLGNAGHGKTYFMIKLIIDTIERQNEEIKKDRPGFASENKIPLYLSLGSYSYSIDESFQSWLALEIEKIYKKKSGLGLKNVKWLVASHQIVPCLDGLDEVDEGSRLNCLKAILEYSRDNSVVFSCRKEEFNELLKKINIEEYPDFKIYEIQKLKKEEIISILELEDKWNEVLTYIQSHDVLYENINTPLLLNLLIITYPEFSKKDKQLLVNADVKEFYNLLWEKFESLGFEKKLEASEDKKRLVRTQTVNLVKRITDKSFSLEQIQPIAWLFHDEKKIHWRVFLYYLTSRLISGILLSIAIGFIIAGPFDFLACGVLCSLIVTLFTVILNRLEKTKTLSSIISILILSFFTITVSGAYQGFNVPRLQGDMFNIGNYYFSKTETTTGVLVGLFFGIIFGFRKNHQTKLNDILPVKDYFFNLKKSLKWGIMGGTGVALFLGICSILIVKGIIRFPSFEQWLSEYTRSFTLPDFISPEYKEDVAVFLLAITTGFILGTLVVAIIAGRYRDEVGGSFTETNEGEKKMEFKDGIRSSLSHSLSLGFAGFFVMSILYCSSTFLITPYPENITRGIMIGIGNGILIFLFWGGFEFIKHWVLRLYLYFYGIAPLNYNQWLKNARDMALIKRVGSYIEFQHQSLYDYYKGLNNRATKNLFTDFSKPKTRIVFVAFLLIANLLIIVLPKHIPYWSESNFGITFKNNDTTIVDTLPRRLSYFYWKKISKSETKKYLKENRDYSLKNDTTFREDILMLKRICVKKSGKMYLTINGKVKVGTFTGKIGPEGAQTALFGAPLKYSYNLVDKWKDQGLIDHNMNHGALMYKNASSGKWAPLITEYKFPWSGNARKDSSIYVEKSDTLEWCVNDIEWQNNSNAFEIIIDSISPKQQ